MRRQSGFSAECAHTAVMLPETYLELFCERRSASPTDKTSGVQREPMCKPAGSAREGDRDASCRRTALPDWHGESPTPVPASSVRRCLHRARRKVRTRLHRRVRRVLATDDRVVHRDDATSARPGAGALVAAAEGRADLVIGSTLRPRRSIPNGGSSVRSLRGGETSTRGSSFRARSTTHRGFKCYRRAVLETIRPRCGRCRRASVTDRERPTAQSRGFRVVEVPIDVSRTAESAAARR